MEEKKKNTVLLTVVAIATLLVAVIGATFAYFQAQGGATVTRNVRIVTETADSTSYNIDKALTLNINQENFAEGEGDVNSDDVTGIAMFTASTGAANDLCYTLEVNVTNNTFVYTTDWNATPTTHYISNITNVGTGYYDDIDNDATLLSNWETALTTAGYIVVDDTDPQNPVTYIKPTPSSASATTTLTAFYASQSTILGAYTTAGYLKSTQVYPTSDDPELVLTVTRATVENSDSSTELTFGSPVTVINGLDVTTLSGVIYVPDTLTNTEVVTSSNKGDLGSFVYFGDTGGPKNIHKLSSLAGKTTAHKYVARLTAKNKNYDQEEITSKAFTGLLTFTTRSCTNPNP